MGLAHRSPRSPVSTGVAQRMVFAMLTLYVLNRSGDQAKYTKHSAQISASLRNDYFGHKRFNPRGTSLGIQTLRPFSYLPSFPGTALLGKALAQANGVGEIVRSPLQRPL